MSRFVILITALLLIFVQLRLWWGENGLLEYWHTKSQVIELETRNTLLYKRNSSLNAQVEDLKQGFAAVEERARYDLGMIGANETFYWILGQPPEVVAPDTFNKANHNE